MLRKVEEGKINKIYIYSLDQLSRNSAQQIALIDEFEKAGVEIIFLSHKVENDPDSKLLLRMKGLLSKPETITTMERSGRRKRHRASCIRVAPFGYKHVDRDREKIKIEINEEEAKVVREVFIWIGEERISIREVVRRLIRTQVGKETWHSSVIYKMLKNPAYKGQAVCGKTKAGPVMLEEKPGKSTSRRIYSTDKENWISIPVPKIVDEELFNIVQSN